MFCPECRAEYREEHSTCPDCEVALVSELPEPTHDLRALVTVLATGHAAILPVARSLLEGSDIPYTVKGEETLGLFPGVGVGLAVDPKAKAAQIQVTADRADEARAILEQIGEEEPEIPDEGA
jgi:hypothetical protein